jgi:hypothetical protein
MGRPNHELVVVATGRELLIIVRPLEAADLLLVTQVLPDEVFFASQVVIVNCLIF